MEFIGFQVRNKTQHITVLLNNFAQLITLKGKVITQSPTAVSTNGRLTVLNLQKKDMSEIKAAFNSALQKALSTTPNFKADNIGWNLTPSTLSVDVVPGRMLGMAETAAQVINEWSLETVKTHEAGNFGEGLGDWGREIDNVDSFMKTFVRDSTLNIISFIKNIDKVTLPPEKISEEAKEEVPQTFNEVESHVYRPNGEEYRPRDIMGHTDVSLMRKFRDEGIYVRLAGPPGGGKTALVEAAFNDIVTINGHGDLTVANFVGTYLPTRDGGWQWSDGPLSRAMREGKVFFVDEGTRIPTEVLNILFSVMDGRNVLHVDDRPDVPEIHADPRFYVVMGYNPATLGARQLDEALVSRFRIQITVETDLATAEALGVPSIMLRIARNMAKRDTEARADGGMGYWVPQMREMLTFRDLIAMGAGERFALANLLASCPNSEDMPTFAEAIDSVSKHEVSVPQLGSMV